MRIICTGEEALGAKLTQSFMKLKKNYVICRFFLTGY